MHAHHTHHTINNAKKCTKNIKVHIYLIKMRAQCIGKSQKYTSSDFVRLNLSPKIILHQYFCVQNANKFHDQNQTDEVEMFQGKVIRLNHTLSDPPPPLSLSIIFIQTQKNTLILTHIHFSGMENRSYAS